MNVVDLEMDLGASSRARMRDRVWPGEDMVVNGAQYEGKTC